MITKRKNGLKISRYAQFINMKPAQKRKYSKLSLEKNFWPPLIYKINILTYNVHAKIKNQIARVSTFWSESKSLYITQFYTD